MSHVNWTISEDKKDTHTLSGVNLNCKGENKYNPECEFNIIIINILTL